MPNYEIDYSYTIREGGATKLTAEDAAEAQFLALQYVRETFDDVENVEIDGIRVMAEGELL
jgi:hypothetical protein